MRLLTAVTLLLAAVYCSAESSGSEIITRQLRTIRSTAGDDLADCECKCCNPRSVQAPVPCPVEVVILLNSAACVKEYWPQMLRTTSDMVDEIFGNHGNHARVAILSYSTRVATISGFSNQPHILKAAALGAAYQGHGDFINLGLESAERMFSQDGSRSDRTRRVLMIMTNSGVVEKRNLAKVQAASSLLRQAKVDIMVNTITPECQEQKACLSCCPDFTFLQKYITTRDRICAADEPNRYRHCLDKMNYMCAAPPSQKAPECSVRTCTCECKQKRGPMGPQGAPGSNGVCGKPGCAGNPGVPGRSGMDGGSGSSGSSGSDGSDGLSSTDVAPNGRQGETGAPGSQGSRGEDGPAGPEGKACGAVGEPGSRGQPGPDGAHGNPGENGQPGDRGQPGSRGAAGKKGLNGPMGAAGNPGKNGMPGQTGAKGQPGAPGSKGRPGHSGDAGARGSNGAPGSKGTDGPRGVDGVNGRQGPPGAPGLVGDLGLTGPAGCAISLNAYQHIIREEIQRKLSSYPHVFRCNSQGSGRRPYH